MAHNGGNLDGLLVVDFTQIAAGPTCTMMLADRGADVIKIEAPGGDLGRALGPPFIAGHGAIFLSLNRNKRSAVLDLKVESEREAVRQLVTRADIVVESFRPGVMEKFGLGYQAVAATNPGVVYCSITAYGQHGPDSAKPGVDGIVQAASGLMSITGAASGPPTKVQAPVVDMVTGFLATTAILDALLAKARTGQGAYLDVSMYAAGVQLQQTGLTSYIASGELPQACGSAAPYSAPNEAFPTADGWVMIAAYQPRRWAELCRLLGVAELAQDPLLATSDSRIANRSLMLERLSERTRQWPTAELLALLEAGDIICGPVNTYADVVASSAFQGMTATCAHAEAGPVQVIAPVGRGIAYRSAPMQPAPLLGEHTQEILELIQRGAS